MMKFATYENIVEATYKYLIPTPKDQCSKPLQLGVSFGSGYVAGVFCAAVSHPADNLVSFLNSAKGATVGDVSPHCRRITDEMQRTRFSLSSL
jgi:solute carrier family 25 (mitochondrial phosphate transporter), member 3